MTNKEQDTVLYSQLNQNEVNDKINDNLINIPEDAYDMLARSLLPIIQRYFETEDGQRAYQEWETLQQK